MTFTSLLFSPLVLGAYFSDLYHGRTTSLTLDVHSGWMSHRFLAEIIIAFAVAPAVFYKPKRILRYITDTKRPHPRCPSQRK